MSRISIRSVLVAACVCGPVASAGVIGTYSVIAPLVARQTVVGENISTSPVRVFVDGHLPVRLRKNENGMFVPASSATLTFVQAGNVIQDTSMGIGLDGTIQVAGLHAGPYSVFVRGADGFAAFGTWLNPPAAEAGEPGSIIDVGLVPRGDMPVVAQIIHDYLRNSRALVSQGPVLAEPDSGVAHAAMQVPDVHTELIQGFGFEVDANGLVHGRVVRSAPATDPLIPLGGLSVYFIHSGHIVSRTQTDGDGRFHITELNPGVYSLVVAGPDAFLALAVDVHPTVAGAGSNPAPTILPLGAPPATDPTEQVNVNVGETTVAYVSPVFVSDLQYLVDQGPLVDPAEVPPPPLAGPAPCCGPGGSVGGGGGYVGGGGGGGGAFGGPGLGTLLGLGAIGVAAAALADDDDDPVPVVSPAIP